MSCFFYPQLQFMSYYIARYYVKMMHVHLQFIKRIFSMSWGPKQNRSLFVVRKGLLFDSEEGLL